jgi:exodeoxyribonuclease VII large subunit
MQGHAHQAITVTDLAKFLSSLVSQNIQPVWIRGEVSNLKAVPNGNSYLSIKDKESKINAIIMANSKAKKYVQEMKNGLEILIFGRVSYYKKEGTISVFVDDIEFLGEGLLKQKFDELKKKLESEGLFEKERKKKIPEYPEWVGVVTSPTGAAIQDILNVMNRRFSGVHLLIFPAAVQGENASREIANAIKIANKYCADKLDVLIVGRGGGSTEDLWCFNEEIVARAIAGSRIPVISAVGHEIDYTIADYVADLRAPTPSAAAELVVKDKKELQEAVRYQQFKMEKILTTRMEYLSQTLELKGRVHLKKWMENFFTETSMELDNLVIRFTGKLGSYFTGLKSSLELLGGKLGALNPKNILKRGYSVTYQEMPDGSKKVVKSAKAIKKGERLSTLLTDGSIVSVVDDSLLH